LQGIGAVKALSVAIDADVGVQPAFFVHEAPAELRVKLRQGAQHLRKVMPLYRELFLALSK
jgi:hypothetical protein